VEELIVKIVIHPDGRREVEGTAEELQEYEATVKHNNSCNGTLRSRVVGRELVKTCDSCSYTQKMNKKLLLDSCLREQLVED
jgi:hypothetical protein